MLDAFAKPFFTEADDAPPRVTLRAADYVALLVQAGVTDPALWPPERREGAAALARVRQIEADCTAQQGAFDWERLPPELQNEYDRLSALLDGLQDTGEHIPLHGLMPA
ncbi:MAG: hypothetical protein JO250_19475 [Armatimonadetes bacterium]|nr:hypothetical protein [Armatimonadota bacterium]